MQTLVRIPYLRLGLSSKTNSSLPPKYTGRRYIMADRQLYHTYKNDSGRYAKVFKTDKGFEVDLHEHNDWLATRKCHGHSEIYAENLGENWVLGIFDINEGE